MASWTTSVRGALPIGRSGRRNGRLRSNKGMRFTDRQSPARFGNWAIRRLSIERRAQGIEQTIPDTAQGPRVTVAAAPQRIVTSPGGGIVLNGDARPVMDGVLQPFVAGKTTDHEALFAAAPGDRGRACQGPQGVVISCPQRLRSLGEQRGENDSADSWPGAKDRHVMLLTVLPRRVLRRHVELGTEAVERPVRLLDLLIDQMQARREVADMRASGFRRTRCNEQWCLAQGLQHSRSIEATDAMVLEDARDRLPGRLCSAGVGTCCQSARNQSSATSSVSSMA